MRFTFAYIDHDQQVHSRFLGPSLENLKGDFDVVFRNSKQFPANNYNHMLANSKNRYIIFSHQDMSFSGDLLEKIQETINAYPDFGVLGHVGMNRQNQYCWNNARKTYEVETLDCCFIVADRENPVPFDEKTFDDCHLYVEDYCMQINKKTGKKCQTILIGRNFHDGPFLMHHSNTLYQQGNNWGKYNFYMDRLKSKWGNVYTT
jgi:hypothetical protein